MCQASALGRFATICERSETDPERTLTWGRNKQKPRLSDGFLEVAGKGGNSYPGNGANLP